MPYEQGFHIVFVYTVTVEMEIRLYSFCQGEIIHPFWFYGYQGWVDFGKDNSKDISKVTISLTGQKLCLEFKNLF